MFTKNNEILHKNIKIIFVNIYDFENETDKNWIMLFTNKIIVAIL